MGKAVTFHWRYMKLAGFILCLIALFVVCAFPSVAIADEGDDLQFEWDADTRTFTLIYNGTEILEIDNSFFNTYATEIGETDAPLSGFYLGTSTSPVEHFVLEGTGSVSWTGTGRIVGMITFDASDGNLISVTDTLFLQSTGTLTSVDFGSNLVELTLSAFSNCSLIEDVDLTSCTSLETITCSNTSSTLRNGPSGSLKLPASLKSIDCQVFSNGNLTSIEFASGTKLESVSAIATVGGLVSGMENLKKIVLPSSLGDYSGVLFGTSLSATAVTVEIPYDLDLPEGFLSDMTQTSLRSKVGDIIVTCAPSTNATNSSLSEEVAKARENRSVTLSVEYQLHQVGTDMRCGVCGQLLSLVYEGLDSGDVYQALVEAAGESFETAYAIYFEDEDGSTVEDISFSDDATTLNVQLSTSLEDGSYVKIFAFSQETGSVSLVEGNYQVEDGAVSFETTSLADAYALAVMGDEDEGGSSGAGGETGDPTNSDGSTGQVDGVTDQVDDATDSTANSTADSLLPQTGDNSLVGYGPLSLIVALAACGSLFAYRKIEKN